MKFIEKIKYYHEVIMGLEKINPPSLQLFKLTNKISRAIDQGQYTLGVFLDLSQAFDKINHKIFTQKL